jgi:hypothetical protein
MMLHRAHHQLVRIREIAVGEACVQIAYLEVHGALPQQVAPFFLPENDTDT